MKNLKKGTLPEHDSNVFMFIDEYGELCKAERLFNDIYIFFDLSLVAKNLDFNTKYENSIYFLGHNYIIL